MITSSDLSIGDKVEVLRDGAWIRGTIAYVEYDSVGIQRDDNTVCFEISAVDVALTLRKLKAQS